MGGHVAAGTAKMLAEVVQAGQPKPVAFVCVNVGPKYGMDYVAILRDMVLRNASNMERDQAFFCITDRPDELPEGVNAIPAVEGLPGWWQKIALFSPDMPWEPGQRIVYFDLDVCITGRLEDLIETKGISEDVGWPCYNSSVMLWDHGEHREVWDRFTPDVMTRSPGPIVPRDLLPAGVPNGGDQEWLTEIGGWDLLPKGWAVSWRWQSQSWPPAESKVVQFHGPTKPHEIETGWVPNVWKIGGFTSLPEISGANTSQDKRLENVRAAIARDIPWFTSFRDEGKTCVICCGAPSMKDNIAEIRDHKRRGARIVSVNNAWRFLQAHGCTPHVNVMVDARPDNAAFIEGAPKSMRFVVASQCHPDVFDALEAGGYETVLWHNGFTGDDGLRDILAPFWGPGPNQRPIVLVPGGSTVGLRSLWLATYSGFRTIHMYGIDSSYAEDGTHHAYAQPLNDQEFIVPVVLGEKTYNCALWMTRQAAEFQQTWRDLRDYVDPDGTPAPVTIHVHGKGLIPDIARELRREAIAA